MGYAVKTDISLTYLKKIQPQKMSDTVNYITVRPNVRSSSVSFFLDVRLDPGHCKLTNNSYLSDFLNKG